MLDDVCAQNPLAKPPGSAMHEEGKCLPSQSRAREFPGVKNLFDHLQLGEMIASANGAEAFIKFGRSDSAFPCKGARVAFPRMLQVEAHFRPPVELGLAPEQVRLEERHAAANVATDQVGVDDAL